MKMTLKGDELVSDYLSSPDSLQDIPWCLIHGGIWHILLPNGPNLRERFVQAYPVRDRHEPDRWRWRLIVGPQHFPLYHRCIRPDRPAYIERGRTQKVEAVLYYHPTTGFQAPDRRGPVQARIPCSLLLMRA